MKKHAKTKDLELEGRFLLVSMGDGYQTELVDGAEIVERVVAVVKSEDRNPKSDEKWAKRLGNADEWICDPDLGPVWFSAGVGEIGRVEVIRVTEHGAGSEEQGEGNVQFVMLRKMLRNAKETMTRESWKELLEEVAEGILSGKLRMEI